MLKVSRLCVPRLPQLMDVVRSNYEAMIDRAHGGPNFMMHSGISQASEYDDPPGLREKAEYLLREWVNLYHSAAAGRDSTKAFSAFVGQVRNLRKWINNRDLFFNLGEFVGSLHELRSSGSFFCCHINEISQMSYVNGGGD